MASNLAGSVAIGRYDACVLRAGRLTAACAPVYGTNAGIITSSIVNLTASAEIEEGAEIDFKNGCGTHLLAVKKADKVKRRTFSGSLTLWDWEAMELLFGGTLIYGKGTYLNKVVGWAEPGFYDADTNPIALEIISQQGAEGAGACSATFGLPYGGTIFPKTKLTLGDYSAAEGLITVNFTGFSENNPNYGSGPWRDFDDYFATLPFPANTAMAMVSYAAIPLPSGKTVRAGYQDTPATS